MRRTTRRRASLLVPLGAALALTAFVAGPSSADPSATAAAPVKVSMEDDFFAPVTAKVPVGGKVVWTNNGKNPHNVTFKGKPPAPNIAPGGVTSRKFKAAGKFPYVCTIHDGMTGSVKAVKSK